MKYIVFRKDSCTKENDLNYVHTHILQFSLRKGLKRKIESHNVGTRSFVELNETRSHFPIRSND